MIHVAMKSTKLYAITFETKITGILLEMIVVNQRQRLEVMNDVDFIDDCSNRYI